MNHRTQLSDFRQRGISLIELMVGLALGLVVVAAVGFAFLGSRQTFKAQDGMSRVQENARYVYELLSSDVREAASFGCAIDDIEPLPQVPPRDDADPDSVSNLLTSPLWWGRLGDTAANSANRQPLIGFDDPDPVATGLTSALAGRDAIRILRADHSAERIVTGYAAPTFTAYTYPPPTFTQSPHAIVEGEAVVACDPSNRHAAIFVATAVAADTLQHAGAIAPIPVAGTRLFPLSAVTYFIRNNAANVPSLYRQRLTVAADAPFVSTEELVEGVEDMQLMYGVDNTSDDADGQVDAYLTAEGVNDNANWGGAPNIDTAEERWRRVLSVRVSLLLVSTARNGDGSFVRLAQPQSLKFNGADIPVLTLSDRRLRQVVTFVVAVRGRL